MNAMSEKTEPFEVYPEHLLPEGFRYPAEYLRLVYFGDTHRFCLARSAGIDAWRVTPNELEQESTNRILRSASSHRWAGDEVRWLTLLDRDATMAHEPLNRQTHGVSRAGRD